MGRQLADPAVFVAVDVGSDYRMRLGEWNESSNREHLSDRCSRHLGGMYVVSKYVLHFINPLTLVVMRFAIGAAVLGMVLLAVRGGCIARKDWRKVAIYGLVGYTISISAQFIGTQLSSAHSGAVITSASPAFIALFAFGMLKERLTIRKIVALLIATAGVLVIMGTDQSGGESTLIGNLFLLTAAVSWRSIPYWENS